jgi:nucleotide sugar dehydrogenase
MPGPEYVDSIMNYPRVYSGLDKASADAAEGFLKTIIDTGKCRLTRLDSTNATEMAKVLENSYRAMNIAFIVEWSRFAEEAGVNLYDVVRAIRARPTHANIMFPGIGVGGYCLTKDPLLASWARSNLFHAGEGLALSEKSVAVNDKMPDFAFRYLSKAYGPVKGKRVLLLGVSYRGDVGDTRSTPVELFYDCLAEAGAKVSVHDPYVGYWQEKDMRVEGDLSRAFSFDPEIVVISAGHRIYTDDSTIAMLLERGRMVIFDTIGALSAKQIGVLGSKHIIKVLGRGDL